MKTTNRAFLSLLDRIKNDNMLKQNKDVIFLIKILKKFFPLKIMKIKIKRVFCKITTFFPPPPLLTQPCVRRKVHTREYLGNCLKKKDRVQPTVSEKFPLSDHISGSAISKLQVRLQTIYLFFCE